MSSSRLYRALTAGHPSWPVIVAASTSLAGVSNAAEPPQATCATAEQRAVVQQRFKTPERGVVDKLREELGLSEAAVIGALPSERAVGVPGSEFHAVWESLRAWPDAVVVARIGGHVLEIHGPIHGGEPSKVSKYFNLSADGPGLTGHLRPDLIGSIFATTLPGRSGDEHGVIFYDLDGRPVFGVHVPAEHAAADDATVRAFQQTKSRIAAMPRACP